MVITIILWCDVILLGGVYMFLVSFPPFYLFYFIFLLLNVNFFGKET